MKRRTDRIIAVSAVTAVAVVPTAILMAVKTGVMSSNDSGDTLPSAQLAQADPANPNSAASGAVTPSASGAPGPGTGTGGGTGAPGGRTGGPGGTAANPSPKPGPELRSFVRKTSVKVTFGTGGDYKQASETATIKLWPSFSMNAVGVTQTMKGGTLSEITQKVIVSGATLSGFDGEKWTKSKLSAAQLEKLRAGSDPRQFTYIIRGVPGNVVTGPDANGRSHYLAQALMGSVYGLLPKESADEVRKVVPDDVGVSLDLWSGKQDRPATIGLSAKAPDGTFDGSMTFGSYR
ncbi:hypothetical protein [Actinomadura verrucosospora]|uniref:Uncharacterized protein n=1 Tax=Actinomadura verrucosospora TaxID=46165 RepID=A0A7D4ATT5_ACTVE|nr:hypothetical protein [Actinomadura verrucosospora]QKG24809.1 hypothetical protein ACTIVE_6458 [Actinomadura verrucosospora]